MQFWLERNGIQTHMVYTLLTVQSRLFQNSSDSDITPNITYFLLLLETGKLVSCKIQLKYT